MKLRRPYLCEGHSSQGCDCTYTCVQAQDLWDAGAASVKRQALLLAADAVQEECHKAEGSVIECERDDLSADTINWYRQIAKRLRCAETDLRERAGKEPI